MRQELLGEHHPDVAQSLNNLAGFYESRGAYEEAESYYLKSLELKQEMLGKSHPDVACGLFNLGGLKCRQGQLEEAKTLLLDARAIYEATVGLEHPEAKALQTWIDGVQKAMER